MNPNWCIHYTGLWGPGMKEIVACRAGIEYRTLPKPAEGPIRLPCVSHEDAAPCAKRCIPTPDQVKEDDAKMEKHTAALLAAMKIAGDAAEAKESRSAVGSAECPLCGGRFRYRVDLPKRRKGFMAIQCETKNCLWMIT